MTFTENGGRPGDERGFIHKKIIKAATSVVTKFTPVGAAISTGIGALGIGRSLLGGGGGRTSVGRSFGRGFGRRTVPRTATARVTPTSMAEKEIGRSLKFPGVSVSTFGPGTGALSLPFVPGGGGGCRPNESTRCCQLRQGDFSDQAQWQQECGVSGQLPGSGVGEAVMGRYGAALEPGNMVVNRAVCLRGMQLADDGLCYNKAQISNKQRMWPAGRKPLLSGGDMRAISIASRAATRLEGATKRLQRLGMMKKATPRRLARHQHAKASTAVVSVP